MSHLLTGDVKKRLFWLTLPTIAGTFAIMVFNLTDTWFVSRLGTEELAAMGFTFPVIMIVGSLAIGFSTGAGSITSRALGAGQRALARRTISDGLVLTIFGTILVSILGLLTVTPLFSMLGAEGHVLELVSGYMNIWFFGAVFAILPPVSDGCLRAAGDMVRPVFVMICCAILNVVLDPILIFGWGPIPAFGINGAAIATVIARAVGACASLLILHYKYRLIDWQWPQLKPLLHSWKTIILLGIPAALTQALTPVAQGYYIRLAASVGGVQAVAAMATGTRIESIVFMISMSYSMAIIPFVGHNYGANAHDRVQETRRISNRLAFIYAGITFLLLIPSARWISSWFSSDPVVIQMSVTYLLFAALGHSGLHLCTWSSQLLNVMGKPKPVLLINLSRVFLFIMPLTLLGIYLFGFTGLVGGLALANLLGGALAFFITRKLLRDSNHTPSSA
ncbi:MULTISPECIES: MATE family efflux transporter [unclassified Lentimonas]|uniref:MATE family efflux transporter n=1 Tax=unclassified Lentimonas TaxID=2630993 RepID=UPI0013221FCA|nr:MULTISPECIES: MATE family efflux transporter [unclassified Lentimonas]CAA6678035.1 Multi antimicrobial extrusion protein (Na(+)/drug antiporter), MATE family of MDR efflux pumps [Lentimonas sp. CC4]CAA6687009.1 Multi antimicrobial extrusion protein (Na(+)/drug antiporter), MATE family of MDR efflux pumps [Lentimonas sp. CC6]CAA6696747.1 Multi antimicrobial extrusion protein (Na(+)/drug antiporter), MATE family of MDR efflux pumps [Lentimonas sp. CC10]CAA6697305.1 Multi antimicrobial extrusio